MQLIKLYLVVLGDINMQGYLSFHFLSQASFYKMFGKIFESYLVNYKSIS